jgi:hypothetical protein
VIQGIRFACALHELKKKGRNPLALTQPAYDEIIAPSLYLNRIAEIEEISSRIRMR